MRACTWGNMPPPDGSRILPRRSGTSAATPPPAKDERGGAEGGKWGKTELGRGAWQAVEHAQLQGRAVAATGRSCIPNHPSGLSFTCAHENFITRVGEGTVKGWVSNGVGGKTTIATHHGTGE